MDDIISRIIEIEFEHEFKDFEKDNNKIIDKDKLLKKIVCFFNSNKIIIIFQMILLHIEMKSDNSSCLFLILLNNPKNKYYYIQIFFEVLEKLKEKNLIKNLEKLSKEFGNEKKDGIIYKEMEEYNKKITDKKKIIYLKKFEKNEKYDLKPIKENASFFTNLVKNGLYLILPKRNPDIKVYFDLFKNMEKYIETRGEDELKSLINYLISINNLYYTKEFQQRLIYFIHYKIKEEKINTLMGKPLDLSEFKELDEKLSDNTVLYIFEESKPGKYEKVSLISNKYEKEAYSVEIFESIKKIEKKNVLNRIILKVFFQKEN